MEAVRRGESVLVAAPTGAGKTVVAEAAAADALNNGGRVFYTTPVKALSNQKFHDLGALFGVERVGLLTGDNSVRGDADVVVMTTEVLRNMIYSPDADRKLRRLRWVILDEVHYLGDPYRGAVWEEIIINAAPSVRFVCLSATISNAETFGRWIRKLRGPVEVVVSADRPVELLSHHIVGDSHGGNLEVFAPVDKHGRPSPRWDWVEANRGGHDSYDDDSYDNDSYGWDEPRGWRFHPPEAAAVIKHLRRRQMLPALYFVFSRAGCDKAAQTLASRIRLASDDDAAEIARIAQRRVECLTPTERSDLAVDEWIDSIQTGIAAHHAGMVPVFKETVEECFIKGLIKVVFATETLALGMNMPARSVVINTLTKFNGTSHQMLRPGEFTQISGRAGRRGIDTVGHCVTLWSPHVEFDDVVSLHNSRSFPLQSVFSPNYNMLANLAVRHTRAEASALLERSFMQFLADEALEPLREAPRRLEDERSRCIELAHSPHGDVAEYRDLLTGASERLASMVARLKRGTVIADPQDLEQRLVVISTIREKRTVKVRTVNSQAHLRHILISSLPSRTRLQPLGEVTLPDGVSYKRPQFKAAAAEALNSAVGLETPTAADAATHAEQHPVAADPQRTERVAALNRLDTIDTDIDKALKTLHKAENRRNLLTQMDAATAILNELGYLDGWALTESGVLLAAIHREQDLLVAETLRHGLLEGLSDIPELVAAASTLIYEHRSRTLPLPAAYPSTRCRQAVQSIQAKRVALRAMERVRGIELTPPGTYSHGFFNHAYAWAAGVSVTEATGIHITAGDFIRNIKLTADLLHQIARAAPAGPLAAQARRAAQAVTRGVVTADAASRSQQAADPHTYPQATPDPPAALPKVLAAVAANTRAPRPDHTRSHRHEQYPQPPPPEIPDPERTHYSVSGLKHRGWTDAMIRDLLGEPDKHGRNPHYRTAAPTRLYEAVQVRDVEETEQFAQRKAQADKRRAARARS